MLERRTLRRIYFRQTLSVEPVLVIKCGKYAFQSFEVHNPICFEYFQSSASSRFGDTELDDMTLSICLDSDAVYFIAI